MAAIVIGLCYLFDLPVLRPWSDLLFRGRPTGHLLRMLAVVTEQRQPLGRALERIARFYPSVPVRRRIARAAAAVNAGTDWRDALRASRVISGADSALLYTSERAGNLPWALRQMALRREKRAVYRLATALQIVYPAAILLLGAFVGFYVISLFLPLVALTEGLS